MRRNIVKGAVVISVGGFISKVIGAVYRVPLTNIIGAEGMGLYQMVFPVYCALLTLSSTGIPTATSKLIAEGKASPSGYFYRSAFLFGGLGLIGSGIMCALGGIIASLQGNALAGRCYVALSPSVFLVSLISCVRGYFQGKGNMYPTAISQVVEQVVKATLGLTACLAVRGDAVKGATLATLAVTVSEAVALLYLMVSIKVAGLERGRAEKGTTKRILSLTLPVTLSAIILPLGHVADSFIIINALGGTAEATALFGVYSGSVASLVGLPVSLCYGAAVACIPAVARGDRDGGILDALRYTAYISLPCAMFLCLLAPNCIGLLYGGLAGELKMHAVSMLTLDAFSVVFLSFLQTTNAILVAMGKQKISVLSTCIALVVRVALCLALTNVGGVGILGGVISAGVSYIIATAINLRFCVNRKVFPFAVVDFSKCLISGIICVLGGFFILNGRDDNLLFCVVGVATAVSYLLITAGLFGKFNNLRQGKVRRKLRFGR